MKKGLIIVSFLLLSFNFAKAEAPAGVLGFMDGKFYDAAQALKYICFLDNNCYDMKQTFAFKREVQGVATTTLDSLTANGLKTKLEYLKNQTIANPYLESYITNFKATFGLTALQSQIMELKAGYDKALADLGTYCPTTYYVGFHDAYQECVNRQLSPYTNLDTLQKELDAKLLDFTTQLATLQKTYDSNLQQIADINKQLGQ